MGMLNGEICVSQIHRKQTKETGSVIRSSQYDKIG